MQPKLTGSIYPGMWYNRGKGEMDMSKLRGRFAPSPSGRMHLGNLFSGLLAWLSVRSAGGTMVLRMEDLDRTGAGRSTPNSWPTICGGWGWTGTRGIRQAAPRGHTPRVNARNCTPEPSENWRRWAWSTPVFVPGPSGWPPPPPTGRTDRSSTLAGANT